MFEIKNFFHKLRIDFSNFMHYPSIVAGENMRIDYDIYWLHRGGIRRRGLSIWQKERADIILSIIEPNSTLIDLGAGDGATLLYLKENKNIYPIGIESSKESLKALQENHIETIEVDLNNLSAIEKIPKVDYITGFEILEHISNPEALLNALRDKAKKGMFFSFPNTGYYTHRLRLLCGRFPLQWVVHPGEHLRFWTIADVRSWVPQVGFKLKKLFAYQGLPGLNRLFPSIFAQGILIFITKI